jgi:hypothetical protein
MPASEFFGDTQETNFTPEEPSWLSKAWEYGTTPITGALKLLSLPGEYTRGLLAGKFGERLSGRQLLDEWGIAPRGTGFDWTGLAAEFIDPLMFAGSITGFTKVGKAAKTADALVDRTKILKGLIEATVDPAAKAAIGEHLSQAETSLKGLIDSGLTKIAGSEKYLASTRLAQVQAGQRGLSLVGDIQLPKFANEALEGIVAKLPSIQTPEKLRRWFSTAKKSLLGDISSQVDVNLLSKKITETDAKLIDLQKMADGEVNRMVSTGVAGSVEEGKELLGKQVKDIQASLGAPERYRQFLDEMNTLEQTKGELAAQRLEKGRIKELSKATSEIEREAIQQKYTRVLDLKTQKIQWGIRQRIQNAQTQFDKMQTTLGTIGIKGTVPRELAEIFHQANVDNLALMKAQGIAITGLDDLIGYVPQILSKDGQRLFNSNLNFQKRFGTIVHDSIMGFQKKRKFKGLLPSELNNVVEKEFGVKNAFVNDPLELYKVREIGTQLAMNRARNTATAIHMFSEGRETAQSLQLMTKAVGGTRLPTGTVRDILAKQSAELVPIEDVLANSGMNAVMIGGKEVRWPIGTAFSKERGPIIAALKEAGIGPTGIPKSVADDLVKISHLYTNNQRTFWKVWDTINEVYRMAFTGPLPSYIGTNNIGNTVMNIIRFGPVNTIKYTMQATREMAKLHNQGHFEKLFNPGFVEQIPLEVEKVTLPAIRSVEGKIFTGKNHVEAMDKALTDLGIDFLAPQNASVYKEMQEGRGFMTNRGRFLVSKEAMALPLNPPIKTTSVLSKSILTPIEQQTKAFMEMGQGGQLWTTSIMHEGKRVRFDSEIADKIVGGILDNPIVNGGKFINNFSESTAKLAHFLAGKAEGLTDLDAIASVKKYLFDYGDLTDFEKQIMRRFVLFYTFSRKNLPLAITETFVNRKAYALSKLSTGTLNSEDFIPAYVRDTGSVAVGGDKFVDIKNPLFEANRFGSQGGGPVRSFQRMIGSTVPQVKLPFELLTGTETFRGKPLEDLTRVKDLGPIPASSLPFTTTFRDKSGKQQTIANPVLQQILRSIPTSRIQQTVEDISNPDVSFFPSVLGPRMRTLPLEMRRTRQLKEQIEKELSTNPEVAKYSRFFSTAEEPAIRTQELLRTLSDTDKRYKQLLGGAR